MDGRSLLAIAVFFSLILAGCTMPWEEEISPVDVEEQEENNVPPIRQVDKTVAIVDESAKEPVELEEEPELEEMPEKEVEEVEEPSNKTVGMMVEFQPPELLLDCNGGCTRYRVYDTENDVAIAAINQSRLIMGKEKEYIILYPLGCREENWDQVDRFEINGSEYWFNFPAAFKRDWADYAEFNGNMSNFSLHEGEMKKFEDVRVFLWEIVPGAFVCDAHVKISIFEEIVVLEEWMDGVVLGLEEEEGELRLNYLMYPEGTID